MTDGTATTSHVEWLDPLKLDMRNEVQPRVEIDQDLIDHYAERMEAGDDFPPVVAFKQKRKGYILADGFHRTLAARSRQVLHRRTEFQIAVEVHEGDERAAILYAAQANRTHGKRRTTEDARKVVRRLLSDPGWSRWSDGYIARKVGVSPSFVLRARQGLNNTAEFGRTSSLENSGEKGQTFCEEVAREEPQGAGAEGHEPSSLQITAGPRRSPQQPSQAPMSKVDRAIASRRPSRTDGLRAFPSSVRGALNTILAQRPSVVRAVCEYLQDEIRQEHSR